LPLTTISSTASSAYKLAVKAREETTIALKEVLIN
jgi:hypothetical protein